MTLTCTRKGEIYRREERGERREERGERKEIKWALTVMINALICINNYVITCINSMLSPRIMVFGCAEVYGA